MSHKKTSRRGLVFSCYASGAGVGLQDLAGEDFLEVGLAVVFERLDTVATEAAAFFGDALVEGAGEESAEVIEIHLVLLMHVAGVARFDIGQRGGGA